MQKVIIDGDSLIYAAAAPTKRYCVVVANDEFYLTSDEAKANIIANKKSQGVKEEIPFYPPLSHALTKAKTMMQNIITACNVEHHELYIAGKQDRNPKNLIHPTYKGHRTQEKPLYHAKVKNYLIEHWNAVECHQIEADDVVVLKGNGHIIASRDKDVLYMTPGNKYDYMKKSLFTVTEGEAYRNFALYVIAGDGGDNIPGLTGYAEPKFTDNGVLIDEGRTPALYKKHGGTIEGDLIPDLGVHLKIAYKGYKEVLKGLSKNEIKSRFELTCKLLWLPINGVKHIDTVVDFEKVYEDA